MTGPTHEGDTPPARAIAARWGVDALADRLGPRADRALALSVLGDVVLVEGWSTGWDIVANDPHVRAVTPEGDLVTSLGVRTADPGPGTVAALEAARTAAREARAGEVAAAKAEETARRDLAIARTAATAVDGDLAALESDRTRAVAELDRIRRAETYTADAIAGLDLRLAALRRSTADRATRLSALRESIARALAGDDGLPARQLQEREAVEQEHASARIARDSANRALGAAVERRRMVRHRLETRTAQRDALQAAPAGSEQLAEARSVEEMARRALVVVGTKLEEAKERSESLRTVISAGERCLATTRSEFSDVEASMTGARERLGQIAVEETELRMREESVVEGLRRDADASMDQALAADRPETEGEEAAGRAARLAGELTAMGPVNLLAREEFRELDERHRLIADQLSDLDRSRTELNKVISSLDTEMEELFSRTFADTARHYRRFFSVLFPGGSGELVLAGGDRPLDAELEIVAQPLGKKVGKLALLSGGERSLAALAFLFAVFKARPAPFYILDEVDAALDDANLHRFLRLVDEFRDHAQLIVVTHQQATVRAADVLYGVTMEPGGSSKALMHRMDDAVVGA